VHPATYIPSTLTSSIIQAIQQPTSISEPGLTFSRLDHLFKTLSDMSSRAAAEIATKVAKQAPKAEGLVQR
jgi:predicted transcriptional regulator